MIKHIFKLATNQLTRRRHDVPKHNKFIPYSQKIPTSSKLFLNDSFFSLSQDFALAILLISFLSFWCILSTTCCFSTQIFDSSAIFDFSRFLKCACVSGPRARHPGIVQDVCRKFWCFELSLRLCAHFYSLFKHFYSLFSIS